MAYVLGALGLASLLFAISSARLAYRSVIERRWLWVLLCLVCAPVSSLSLPGGTVRTSVLSIVFFGIAYFSQPDGTAVLQVGLPLGALLFRHRRMKLLAAARPARSSAQLARD